MHKLLLAATGLLVAAPVTAQGAGPLPFEGARVEGLLGVDHQQSPFPGDAGESNGIVYGVAAGYDIRRGNVVFGPEIEFTGATTDTRGDGIVAAGDRIVVDSGRDLSIGGRVGYVVTPRAMAYAKAGYSNFRTDRDYSGSATTPAFQRGVNSDGVRLGAGVEVQASGNAYVKAEYRYSDYSDGGVEDRQQLLAGFGFRF